MIYGNVKSIDSYGEISENFRIAFNFLSRDGLKNLPESSINIGHGVRANIQHYQISTDINLSFETHNQFFDIQFIISGEEIIKVFPRKDLKPIASYDEKSDTTLYEDPERSSEILLQAGDYLILSPQDGHKPRCFTGKNCQIRKVVVKVPV